MAETEIIEFIKAFVLENFEDDIIAVYGIGSSFESNVKARDVDVIVVLKNLDKCPSYDWTPARFEKLTLSTMDNVMGRKIHEVWFLYNTMEGYMNKEVFKTMSFANWEWSVRGLKFSSVLIMGEDIRGMLHVPPYDYDDILIRCAYHLEPSTKYKLNKVRQEGGDPQEYEKNRFTKSIFKFGFCLIAYLFPDENVFSKEEVYDKLLDAYASDVIDGRILDFYDLAIDYRQGITINNFESLRKEFLKVMVKETIYVLEKLWIDIKALFRKAFGRQPFTNLLNIIDREGWE